MQDKDLVAVITIEDPAWRLHYLAITRLSKFWRPTATFRMVCKLLDMTENAFDQFRRSDRAFQCDVVGNGVQIRQCRLGPDYFSHLARRFLA